MLNSKTPTDPYFRLFRRHVEILAVRGAVVLVVPTPMIERLLTIMADVGIESTDVALCCAEEAGVHSGLSFCSIDDVLRRDDVAGVLIASREYSEHIGLSVRFNGLKARSIPVTSVFGYTPTPEPLNVECAETGTSYPGMFKLAADWGYSLRRPNPSYVEFGIFEGRTLIDAWHAFASIWGPRARFVGFDTFGGIAGAMKAEESIFPDGSFYANKETVLHNLRAVGCDLGRFQLIGGDILETCRAGSPATTGLDFGDVVVVNIDVDIYEPARVALEFLTDKLADGALLLMDDFDSMAARNDLGERRALREWCDEHSDQIEVEPYRSYGIFGRSFIVHRLSEEPPRTEPPEAG